MTKRFLDFPGDAESANPDVAALDSLGLLVRRLYIGSYRNWSGRSDFGEKLSPAWDGGTDHFGQTRRPIWPKIAQKLLALGATPIDFIAAQFRTGSLPSPNDMFSDEAVENWQRACEGRSLIDELTRELHNDRSSLEGAVVAFVRGPKWPYVRALRYALGHTIRVQSTPLFRYCTAVATGQEDFAKYYFDEARWQLLCRQNEYTAVYGDLIPLALHNAVKDLRRSFGLA
jgi:hypothetical protein